MISSLITYKHNGMSTIKIASASQAKYIHKYKNRKNKLAKCCANIYFNTQCLKHKLTPNYSNIKIPRTSPAATYTQHKR